ncbi:hypothetical protein VAEKB19_5610013 [Vibrio aestuarianus]|nr:hypothetical protein VAEKB19_5610013 [Vibrio aestuarianus]
MSSSSIRINLYALEDRLVAILVSIDRLEYSYDRANVQTSVLFSSYELYRWLWFLSFTLRYSVSSMNKGDENHCA